VTNPLFLERKQGFISKEAGNQDFGQDLAFQKVFEVPLGPSASSGTRGDSTEASGARDKTNTNPSTGTRGSGENDAAVEAEVGDNRREGSQRLP
jgi:hypothetical protein